MIGRVTYILIIILGVTFNANSQYSTEIEYDKTMCELINVYRKSLGKSKLTWSNNIYNTVTKSQVIDAKETYIKTNELSHPMPLLKKYGLAEILVYNYTDTNKCFKNLTNPFTITCLSCGIFSNQIKEDYTNFMKKHFMGLYKKTLVKTKITSKIDKTHYTGKGLKVGRYAFKRNILIVDSVVDGVSYIRSYNRLPLNKKIAVNDYDQLPAKLKEKLRNCMAIMQWHYSPGHRKIMLGKYKYFASSSVIVNGKLISGVNFNQEDIQAQ